MIIHFSKIAAGCFLSTSVLLVYLGIYESLRFIFTGIKSLYMPLSMQSILFYVYQIADYTQDNTIISIQELKISLSQNL